MRRDNLTPATSFRCPPQLYERMKHVRLERGFRKMSHLIIAALEAFVEDPATEKAPPKTMLDLGPMLMRLDRIEELLQRDERTRPEAVAKKLHGPLAVIDDRFLGRQFKGDAEAFARFKVEVHRRAARCPDSDLIDCLMRTARDKDFIRTFGELRSGATQMLRELMADLDGDVPDLYVAYIRVMA